MPAKETTGKNSGQPEAHDDAKAPEMHGAATKPATRKASQPTPDLKTRHKGV